MLIIGHRGDRKDFDDNSVEGIASALEKGADGVEFDVFYKPDKGVYLNHRFIHDVSKPYPTLEEIIQIFADKGKLQIEIKPPEIETVKAVVDLVKKYKLTNYEITSSILPLLRHVRDLLPQGHIGMIVKPYLIEDWMTEELGDYLMLGYLTLTGANSIWLSDPRDFWTQERVERFHNKGYRVNSHLSTDSEDEYKRLDYIGLDSCTADNLDVLKWTK